MEYEAMGSSAGDCRTKSTTFAKCMVEPGRQFEVELQLQESVGRLGLGSTQVGIGNALGGLAGQQNCACVQTLIAQIQGLEFVLCPIHSRSTSSWESVY